MPLECVAIRNAAQNQMVSGKCERCRIVPAVTGISFRHRAHRKVSTSRLGSYQDFVPPQRGQRKPSGQRLAAR
jgi:hypothetical protein